METTYDLNRFLKAQERSYAQALREIREGEKQTHWMWYIFPQLKALGRSPTAQFYGIEHLEEAKAYLAHPILGARLREISEALLQVKETNPLIVMGDPDHLKLRSSMTLFAQATEDNQVFFKVLQKFFGGEADRVTLELLEGK